MTLERKSRAPNSKRPKGRICIHFILRPENPNLQGGLAEAPFASRPATMAERKRELRRAHGRRRGMIVEQRIARVVQWAALGLLRDEIQYNAGSSSLFVYVALRMSAERN